MNEFRDCTCRKKRDEGYSRQTALSKGFKDDPKASYMQDNIIWYGSQKIVLSRHPDVDHMFFIGKSGKAERNR